MTTQEENQRVEALSLAVRHRIREEKPEQVINAALMYYKFLQGKT